MKTGKIIPSLFFLCSFFLTLLGGAIVYGQEGTIDRITITPPNPGTDDKIKIKIFGTVPNGCYNDPTASGDLDSCGVRIDMVMTRRSNCIPFGGRVDWDLSATVDPLEAGSYTVYAELRDLEENLQDSMTTSFFVFDYTDVTDVQIVQIRSNMLTNLHVSDPLLFLMDAVGPEGTAIQYRFFYRFGYGTPAWDASNWVVEQDWSSSNSTQYTFSEPGTYYVIGHVRAEGAAWGPGDPQGGFIVEVKQ